MRNLNEIITKLELPPVPMSDGQKKERTFRQALLILESTRKEEMAQRSSMLHFFLRQIIYIGWKVWLCHAGLLLVAVLFALQVPPDSILGDGQMLAVISTVSPLLVLIGMRLLARSYAYRMVELEMSTYYSMEHLLLSRLCLFAITDFIGLAGLAGCLSLAWGEQLGYVLLYLFTPFTVSAAGCLWLFNQPRIRDKSSACSIFTLLLLTVQMADVFRASTEGSYLYGIQYGGAAFAGLLFILVLSVLAGVIQLRRLLRMFRHLEGAETL